MSTTIYNNVCHGSGCTSLIPRGHQLCGDCYREQIYSELKEGGYMPKKMVKLSDETIEKDYY